MAQSSIMGGEKAPSQAEGRDTDALGPSDTSDSGSDVQGERPFATVPDDPFDAGAVPVERQSSSDSTGTGERSAAVGSVDEDADIEPDTIRHAPNDAFEAADVSLDDPNAADVESLAVDDSDEDVENPDDADIDSSET